MYGKGEGVPQDHEKALQYLERSATLGNVNSQYRLGRMYLEGALIESNIQKSAYWMEKALQAGHPEAKEYWDKYKLSKYK